MTVKSLDRVFIKMCRPGVVRSAVDNDAVGGGCGRTTAGMAQMV